MTRGPALESTPLVSLGLPVYDGERFLIEAIDALVAQTFVDFELIISDNASTDATEAICREHARRDARIRYWRSIANRGAVWNHNRVLDLARGEFFKWVHHDDICAPTFLEQCVGVFRSEPSAVVLVYPRSRVIDEHGAVLWEHWDGLDLRKRTPHQRLKQLVRNPPNMGTSVFGLARTSALRQTRGILPILSPDYLVLAELALLGEFREVPELHFLKRYHRSCRVAEAGKRHPGPPRVLDPLRPAPRGDQSCPPRVRRAGPVLRHLDSRLDPGLAPPPLEGARRSAEGTPACAGRASGDGMSLTVCLAPRSCRPGRPTSASRPWQPPRCRAPGRGP